MPKTKLKEGRPTKYDPAYCDEIEDFMGQGFSQEAFAGKVGVDEDTITNWKKEYTEFLGAVKRGEAKSRIFWEELGVVGTTEGKNFNATTWIFNMKNRFKWRDLHDITSNNKELKGLVEVNYGKKD